MSNYVRSNGAPVLVERRSYGNLPPRAMSGWVDTLVSAGKNALKAASDAHQAQKGQAATDPGYAAPAPASGGGMGKYVVPVAVGGAALLAIMLLRKKGRR